MNVKNTTIASKKDIIDFLISLGYNLYKTDNQLNKDNSYVVVHLSGKKFYLELIDGNEEIREKLLYYYGDKPVKIINIKKENILEKLVEQRIS